MENLMFKQQEQESHDQQEPSRLNNSIEPSIKESERFIFFLNKRFNLNLDLNDLTILISETSPNIMGYFSPKECVKRFENTTQRLRAIVLNPLHLKENPYETIAHELAHFINDHNNIKDTSGYNYHNKHFKDQAEKLLLIVSRTNKGYAHTEPSEAFIKMVNEEFIKNPSAFHIQQINHNNKKGTRLFKWVCECGFIIRCGDKSLRATCNNCETEFQREDSEGEN